MRVLVVGGSGALGVPVVRALVAGGHEVWATSRGTGRQATIREAGGTPLVADLLDPSAVERAVGAAEPEVVVHAATALPAGGPQRWAQASATNALRARGTAVLMSVAGRLRVRRVVSQSFLGGYRPVADAGQRLSEAAPFAETAGAGPSGLREVMAALRALEEHTLHGGVQGVVLRFGFFYGDPAGTEALLRGLRRRRLPLPGGAPGVVSFVHVDDAAAAVLAAVEQAVTGDVFNVAEEPPRPFGQHLRQVAEAAGAPPPFTVPAAAARLVAPAAVEFVCRHRPLDAAAIRARLGWSAIRRSTVA
jgi:nucleoside-diphosphate-sugar epimerase